MVADERVIREEGETEGERGACVSVRVIFVFFASLPRTTQAAQQ